MLKVNSKKPKKWNEMKQKEKQKQKQKQWQKQKQNELRDDDKSNEIIKEMKELDKSIRCDRIEQ